MNKKKKIFKKLEKRTTLISYNNNTHLLGAVHK